MSRDSRFRKPAWSSRGPVRRYPSLGQPRKTCWEPPPADLPVSENDEIPANYGLRHRAAIGITEVTDSIVLIVSEETGQTSIAINGILYHNLSRTELKQKLRNYLLEENDEKVEKVVIAE